jgi:hypothetical protein
MCTLIQFNVMQMFGIDSFSFYQRVDMGSRRYNALQLVCRHTKYILDHISQHVLVAVLYKPGGRRFDSRWCHWNCTLT